MKLDDAFDIMGADFVAPAGLYPANAGKARKGTNRRFSRILDVAFALLAAPIVVAVALVLLVLNPIFNPGPLFFSQKRMGKDCSAFRMWKFRTMLPSPVAVRSHDAPLDRHRITRLGALLRKSRLDELPNLINVLRGDMSFVGPRPERPEFVAQLEQTIPYYRERHTVKPGLTGWAQLCYPYGASEQDAAEKLLTTIFDKGNFLKWTIDNRRMAVRTDISESPEYATDAYLLEATKLAADTTGRDTYPGYQRVSALVQQMTAAILDGASVDEVVAEYKASLIDEFGEENVMTYE